MWLLLFREERLLAHTGRINDFRVGRCVLPGLSAGSFERRLFSCWIQWYGKTHLVRGSDTMFHDSIHDSKTYFLERLRSTLETHSWRHTLGDAYCTHLICRSGHLKHQHIGLDPLQNSHRLSDPAHPLGWFYFKKWNMLFGPIHLASAISKVHTVFLVLHIRLVLPLFQKLVPSFWSSPTHPLGWFH